MQPPREAAPRSRVPWALAVTVGLCSGLAGYVIHAAMTRRAPKQVVTVQRLTEMAGSEQSPAISPDGTRVAFEAMSGGKRQIWVRQVSGGSPQEITTDDTDHYGPRWSADSNNLIYFAGGRIREVPALGPGDLSHGDGSLAYFRRADRAVELVAGGHAIAKLAVDGTYSNLRWSPDDKKIAYLQDQTVMVIGSSGGEPARAADLSVQGFAWTPDNSGLIVSTRGDLWFVPRSDRDSLRQLTFGELSYESPDISATGRLVASRRGLYAPEESDIVILWGLKW